MDFVESSLLSESVHWLSKSGTLPQHERWRSLTTEQKVKLYEYFRENGERWESEWRSSFCELVSISSEELPAMSDVDGWGDQLFRLIESGSLEAVRNFIETVCPGPVTFDPSEAYDEGRKHTEGSEPEFVPFDYYPIQACNDDSEYAIPYAEQSNQTEIASYLSSILEAIQEAWKVAFREGYRQEMKRRKTFEVTKMEDGTLSRNGRATELNDLIEMAKEEQANFLLIRAFHGEGSQEINEIWSAFNSAGVIPTFNSYEVVREEK